MISKFYYKLRFLFIIFGLIYSNYSYALEDLCFIEGTQDIHKEPLEKLLSYIREGGKILKELSDADFYDDLNLALWKRRYIHEYILGPTQSYEREVTEVPSKEICIERGKRIREDSSREYSPEDGKAQKYYNSSQCYSGYDKICKWLCALWESNKGNKDPYYNISNKIYKFHCYTSAEVEAGDKRACYIHTTAIHGFSRKIESELLDIEKEIQKRYSDLESDRKNLQETIKIQDTDKTSLLEQIESSRQEVALTKDAIENVTQKINAAYCTSLLTEINKLREIHSKLTKFNDGLRKLQDELSRYNRIVVLLKNYFHLENNMIDLLLGDLRKFTMLEDDLPGLGSKSLLFKTEMEKFIKALEALSIFKSKKIPEFESIEKVEKNLWRFEQKVTWSYMTKEITEKEYDRLKLIADIMSENAPEESPQLEQFREALGTIIEISGEVEGLYEVKVHELEQSECPDKEIKQISHRR